MRPNTQAAMGGTTNVAASAIGCWSARRISSRVVMDEYSISTFVPSLRLRASAVVNGMDRLRIKSPPLVRAGQFSRSRCVCLQAEQQLLADLREPGFPAHHLRRDVRPRQLENFHQPARLGGHPQHPVAQVDRFLDGMRDNKDRALLL